MGHGLDVTGLGARGTDAKVAETYHPYQLMWKQRADHLAGPVLIRQASLFPGHGKTALLKIYFLQTSQNKKSHCMDSDEQERNPTIKTPGVQHVQQTSLQP